MPFDLLRRAAGQPRFAWLWDDTAWVGWGLREAVTAQGPERFREIQRAAQSLLGTGTFSQGPAFVGFGFSPEDHHRAPWWTAFPAALLALPEVVQRLPLPDPIAPPAPGRAVPALGPWPRPQEQAWRQAVTAALRAIDEGRLHKVVLARAEAHPLAAPVDPVAVLQALRARHPRAFCFLFEPEPGVAFVGATPELLVRVPAPAQVQTVALAGTVPRGTTPAEDAALGQALLQSDKDRREHALVAEAMRATLAPLTTTLEVPAAPRLRRLPQVQHLETPIRGTLRPGVGLLDVAAALHPTPALGGVPREAALAFIAAHEPQPRGWYAAPVGVLFPDGSGELAVAIRSALLLGEQAVVFAGAGIVAGSDPAREWDETALKMTTMRQALAEAERLAVGRRTWHLEPRT